MITITRDVARQVRAIFRRALNASRGRSPLVWFTSGAEGLHIRAKLGGAAVEYHEPGELPPDQLVLPMDFLADCEGKKPEPVMLEGQPDGSVTVQWCDGRVPQLLKYTATESDADNIFPSLPEAWSTNRPGLIAAMHHTMQAANADSTRYALDHIQLDSHRGRVTGTDGRHLLVQSGFEFPWPDNVLVPRTTVFGSPELPVDQPVQVGRSGDWVLFRVLPWTVWLEVNAKGRYPDVDDFLSRPDLARTTLTLAVPDAEFLLTNLAKLPGSEEYGWAVTLDLDQIPAVRARAQNSSKPTELVLVNSNCQGEAMLLTSDRRYLQFALRLGMREIHFYSPEGAILARDESRNYMWVPLTPALVVKPSPDAVRIESTQADPEASSLPRKPCQTSKLQQKRTLRIMPNTRHHTDTAESAETAEPQSANQADRTEAHAASRSPVELATELRDQLRQTVASASELLAALKQQQRQTRLVHATLDSLKQLQRAAG